MQRWQNMLLQVLEHKWKTPRGQNKRERRRYLIVLIKCFKALNISPPQAALTEFSALLRSFRDARHSSTIFQMIRSERAEPRRRGRCWHHSRLIPAERQLARVPRRQEQEIKLWLEWFEIQAQACWALWSRATWTDWLPELHWHHGVCVTIRAR